MSTPPRHLRKILKKLERVQSTGGCSHTASCPAHSDQNPSLSIDVSPAGKILVHCHAGCRVHDVVEALGLEMRDLFPTRKDKSNLGKTRRSSNTKNDAANFADISQQCQEQLTSAQLQALSEELCVSAKSLAFLELGWAEEAHAWTFPERNAQGNVIGIARRMPDGRKGMLKGSRRGLYIPPNWQKVSGQVLVVEGPTDTAAAFDLGFSVIGRPSATGGVDLLAELLEEESREILILGENDKKYGEWPGRKGAQNVALALAFRLHRDVGWGLPPSRFKDLRDFARRAKR